MAIKGRAYQLSATLLYFFAYYKRDGSKMHDNFKLENDWNLEQIHYCIRTLLTKYIRAIR